MIQEKQKSVFERAIDLAVRAHCGMVRKKDGSPYILHPLEAAVIAGTMTRDEEVLAAAVLHDAVEDTEATLEDVRECCGDRVMELVAAETEDKRHDQPAAATWRLRKEESLRDLRDSGDKAVKILWLSDKLSNVRSFYRLWKVQGDAIWNGFNEKNVSEQAWYYRTIALLLEDLKDTDAWKEYDNLTRTIFSVQEGE